MRGMLLGYVKKLFQDKELINKCLTVAVPLMLQALVVNSVTLVDNLMIGELGDAALSGVSSANRYYIIVNYCSTAISAAGIIFLSQYYGAQNENKMKECFRILTIFSLLTGAVFVFLARFFPEQILRFIIDDDEVVRLGGMYLKLCCLSYLPTIVSVCIGASMRALGRPKVPMLISIFSVLLNVAFDYVFIFGRFGLPALGVEGAAVATLLARLIEMILYIFALHASDMPFKTRITEFFRFEPVLMKRILSKAGPLLINEFLYTFGNTFLLKCYSFRGVSVNTAYTMTLTVQDLFFVLFSGMATATSVLIGIPLGAGELEKAKDNGYKLFVFSLLLSLLFGSVMFGVSFLFPVLYRNVSEDALYLAERFLKVNSLFFIAFTFNTQTYFTLRAGGQTRQTMVMDSVFMWSVMIPTVYILDYHTAIPVVIVYMIGQGTEFLKGILSWYFFRKEKWVVNLTE